MRFTTLIPVFGVLLLGTQSHQLENRDGPDVPDCRCVPGEDCWPSNDQWNELDKRLGGRLIKNEPIARSCYDGPDKDLEECAYVTKMWPDQDFMTENPIGRALPYNVSCAPVDYAHGSAPTTCVMGQSPTYAVNVTSNEHIEEALKFAQESNIRVTVTSTGHDMLGRSDGYGSLEIWLYYRKNSLTFQETYEATNCSANKSNWTGSALNMDGTWQWRDAEKVAKENDVIVVTGGSVSVGATGGFLFGGGHGPASRNYGLGADQILEAEVMLADGSIVIANHCQNTDLFRAIRGGGPGYGIVLRVVIKAHPNVDVVTTHKLVIAPYEQTDENADLLDAVTILLQRLPAANEAGYSGYSYWYRNLKEVFVNNATSGYQHGIWTIGQSQEESEAILAPILDEISDFKDRLFINSTYVTYPDYWSFYDTEMALYDPAGVTWALTSTLYTPESVEDFDSVRETVDIISGKPEEYAANVILMASGGQVWEDAKDPTSGLHPAWRRCPYAVVTYRNPAINATNEERQAINDDITFVKAKASRKLSPGTGAYMNEADRNDDDYIEMFYGSNYKSHLAAKNKYDPEHVFYCPTCVGAEAFVDNPNGALCRA